MNRPTKTKAVLVTVSDEEYSLTTNLMINIRRDFPDWEVIEELLPNNPKKLKKSLSFYSDYRHLDYVLIIDKNGYSSTTTLPAAMRQVCDKPIDTIPFIDANGKVRRFVNFIYSVRKSTTFITFPERRQFFPLCYDAFKQRTPTNSFSKINFTASTSTAPLNTSGESRSQPKTVVEIDHLQEMISKSRISSENESDSMTNIDYYVSKDKVCDVSSAIVLIENIFKECSVRRVMSIKSSYADGHVTAEAVLAKVPFPLFEMSEVEGYSCKYEDGAGLRHVRSGVQYGRTSHEIKKGECVFVHKSDPLPYGTDCVVEINCVSLLKMNENNTATKIGLNILPTKGLNVTPVGNFIKLNDVILNPGVLIGQREICTMLDVGVTAVQVFEKPKIAIFSIACIHDKENYPEADNMMMLTLFKSRNFHCKLYGVVMEVRSDILRRLVSAFEESDIVVTSLSVYLSNRILLTSILENDFNGVIQFGRLDAKNGKRVAFVTCTFKGKSKFVFTMPGYMHAIMMTVRILILPTLMYWMGLDNFEWMKLNVWVDDDVPLLKRPQFLRAKLQYSALHQCPKAVIREPVMRSLFQDTSRDDLILQLPPAEGTQNILQKGTTIKAILMR